MALGMFLKENEILVALSLSYMEVLKATFFLLPILLRYIGHMTLN